MHRVGANTALHQHHFFSSHSSLGEVTLTLDSRGIYFAPVQFSLWRRRSSSRGRESSDNCLFITVWSDLIHSVGEGYLADEFYSGQAGWCGSQPNVRGLWEFVKKATLYLAARQVQLICIALAMHYI